MFQKILPLFLSMFLLCSFNSEAQVVTSKKTATKKGIYQKPTAKSEVVATDKKGKSRLKNITDLLNNKDAKDVVVSPAENYLALQMINNAMTFIGVRYKGGGTTTSGMDCSGMVTAVFNLFEMKIPRSSSEMAKYGEKIANSEAQKGDLVFFKTNGRGSINHVGMVVEVDGDEIKFVHSSTSKGVIVSSTKEPYYSRAFAQVNRVL